MEFLKKCCQCFCFSECACNAACCIDVWHSCEAFGMACLYCDSCCWTLCAPLCIDCKIGDSGKAMESCSKCVRYCIFGCALDCVGICDGIYNCVQIIKQTCGGQGVKSYVDLTKNTQWLAVKVKQSLGFETGAQPQKSMQTFQP